ncbi:MAG: hypothetical protein FWG77_07875 [Treponema sp.]|nr:hypothetical protein [Treponema sp.]
MKKIQFGILLALSLLIFSCSQDSIFYDISFETRPRQPIIPGSPTNMAVVRNQVFVGTRMSQNIYAYGESSGTLGWTEMRSPGAAIGEIVTDGHYLYALVFPGGDPLRSSAIMRYNFQSDSWDRSISMSGYSIQTLFNAGGNIFAGVQSSSNRNQFAIVYYDTNTNTLDTLLENTFLLTGVGINPSGNIYLGTAGNGIYLYRGGAITGPLTGTAGITFSGLRDVGGNIVGVTGNGYVFHDITGHFASTFVGVHFTGAMSVWNDPRNSHRPTLLLMGIRGRGTSLSQGYREMVLINGRPSFEIRAPGESEPTSVINRATYAASIGRLPVEAILQVPDRNNDGPLDYRSFASDPDWEPPIFASTSRSGLWAYRNGEWNAED